MTHYLTWDEAVAGGNVTDEPDGLPDRLMVPFIEALRAAGVVTLQSCQGHPGSDDGCLWVLASSVPHLTAETICLPHFEKVSHTVHPVQRWEFVWLPENFWAAMTSLAVDLPNVVSRPGSNTP